MPHSKYLDPQLADGLQLMQALTGDNDITQDLAKSCVMSLSPVSACMSCKPSANCGSRYFECGMLSLPILLIFPCGNKARHYQSSA